MDWTIVRIKDDCNVGIVARIHRTLEKYLRKECETLSMRPYFTFDNGAGIILYDPEYQSGFIESNVRDALVNSEYGDLMKYVLDIEREYRSTEE